MPDKTLVIRADASAEIGAGHVMRCIALAQAWQQTGARTIFAQAEGGEFEARIRSEGGQTARIHAKPGSSEDAAQVLKLCNGLKADWLVIDGYHFSADYCRSLESDSFRLLLIGDDPMRQLSKCDVVLNPDPDASLSAYPQHDGRIQFLLGSQYALLRREFLDFSIGRSNVPEKARRVLITFGGSDPRNITLHVLRALDAINDLELEVTLAVGAGYQHLSSLQAAAGRSSHIDRLLCDVRNMPDLMANVDLAIKAGGGTCYELAFMRVPMFIITTAENQERAARAFGAAAAAVDAGWFSSLETAALVARLRDLICDQDLRRKLVENAAHMVDGKGAGRVVETMLAISRGSQQVIA